MSPTCTHIQITTATKSKTIKTGPEIQFFTKSKTIKTGPEIQTFYQIENNYVNPKNQIENNHHLTLITCFSSRNFSRQTGETLPSYARIDIKTPANRHLASNGRCDNSLILNDQGASIFLILHLSRSADICQNSRSSFLDIPLMILQNQMNSTTPAVWLPGVFLLIRYP